MMASETKTTSSGGIGFFGLLTILFISLKLTGYIGWSWWWVTAPLWGIFALIAAVFLLITLWHAPKIIIALVHDLRRARK